MEDRLSGDVHAFFSIRSFSEFREKWSTHPVREYTQQPELKEFISTLLSSQGSDAGESGFMHVLENEFELTVDELFELFPGSASIAVFNLDELLTSTADHPDLLVLAEFSGTEDRLGELMQIQFERNAEAQKKKNPLVEHEWVQETFMGETLHFDEVFNGEVAYTEDGYALVDGVFILGAPKARLRAAVESIKRVGLPPVAESEPFLRRAEEFDQSEMTIYFNLLELMPSLNQKWIEEGNMGSLAQFGITSETLDEALALGELEGFSIDLELTEEGAQLYSSLMFDEKKGVLSLMTYSEKGLPSAHFVPTDVMSTSVSRFDFAAMMAQLEKLLTVGSPNLPILADIQMQNIKNQTGVDLRSSILQNLGDEFVSMAIFEEGKGARDESPVASQQLYALRLRDGALFSQALEAFKDIIPGVRSAIKTQEFAGQTIHTFGGNHQTGDTGNVVSYTVTRSHLFVGIGPVGLLQEVLNRLEDSEGGFWGKASTEDLFERIARPNAVTRSYLDFQKMADGFFDSMLYFLEVYGRADVSDAKRLTEGLTFPYVIISEMNEASHGFFSRSALIPLKDAE